MVTEWILAKPLCLEFCLFYSLNEHHVFLSWTQSVTNYEGTLLQTEGAQINNKLIQQQKQNTK